MRGKCEKCEKESEELEIMLYQNSDRLHLCPECWDHEDCRAEMEIERQKEESWYDNPDHERDIPE